MSKRLKFAMLMTVLALFALAGAAVFAQEETATVAAPSFTDGRINNSTLLGGLAIYCVDASSSPVSTFENGGITVWGVGDQKYINLSAAQLQGMTEIPQTPSMMEAQMTQTAPAPMMTEEAMPMMEVTVEVMGETAVLLAQATTPNGEIAFFSFGDQQFALQGRNDEGKLFTYRWIGCTEGMLDQSAEAYLPELEATATVEFMELETPEVTPAS